MLKQPKIGVLIPEEPVSKLFTREDLESLRQLGNCRFNEMDRHLDQTEAIEFLKDAQVAIGSWGTVGPCSSIIEACPELQLWEHVAGTVKKFFNEISNPGNLTVASCAPAIADSVAEMTIGQLIFGLRRILNKQQRLLGSEALPDLQKINLFSSTVGVIGASQVGRRVVKLLQPFGAKVLLFDPYISAEEAESMGARLCPDLIDLFRLSDAVTMHTPALPETKKMVGRNHFSAMREGSVFVNTSRGSCIDEEALIEVLSDGRIFAFLDVVDSNLHEKSNPLRKLPNCFLTPHIAGGANFRMGRQAVEDIKAFLSGKPPLMAVSVSQLSRLA